MSRAIELADVVQSFAVRESRRGPAQTFIALDRVDLAIGAGEFVTIVGPSGCGKSTVLDLIAGLAQPTSGDVRVNGSPVRGPGLDRGVVFQQYTLLPWRTARGNVEFALEARGGMSKRRRSEVAMDYLEMVGLAEFAERYPSELSGGMKQRVAIARSLSYSPQILLMDEPFGALDAQSRENLQEQLLIIWKATGTTIVFVTHDIEEAVFLGQRVVVMSARPGRIQRVLSVDLDRDDAQVDVRSTPQFSRLRQQIWNLLRSEQKRAASDGGRDVP